MLLIARERGKGQIRKIPEESPDKSGKSWKNRESPKKDKKGQSGVNKSARERISHQNLSQKVPSKKGSLGVIFSPRNSRENAHSKSANFEGRHSGGHLLGRPLLFTSETKKEGQVQIGKPPRAPFETPPFSGP